LNARQLFQIGFAQAVGMLAQQQKDALTPPPNGFLVNFRHVSPYLHYKCQLENYRNDSSEN
jgi:hypothetical protein